jgi:hypothetical protein
MENKEKFVYLCSKIKRDGIDELMNWLETTDFYEAPASTRFHGAYKGGLLEHSLNVYTELERILTAYPLIEYGDEESILISSLFHDLCKVNFYETEKRNRKNEYGQWESYDAYKVNEKFAFGGHGSKSVFILQQFIKLKPHEAVAINCHMGAFESDKVGKSYEKYPFAWALHIADEAATYLLESEVS